MTIIDSSSLILLAKLNMLDKLIKKSKQKLVIPAKVYEECTAKKESFDAKIIEKRVEEKLIVKRVVSNRGLCNKIVNDFNLGRGEAEAVTLCIETESGIITDDRKAINACRILKIKFTTVPKILVQFYKRKLLSKSEVNLMIKQLQEFGRYSDEIINQVKEELK